jgi:hypothetical protein
LLELLPFVLIFTISWVITIVIIVFIVFIYFLYTRYKIQDTLFSIHNGLFLPEVERWTIRWVLVDDKPKTIRHSTCNKRDLYPAIYSIIIFFYHFGSAKNNITFRLFCPFLTIPLRIIYSSVLDYPDIPLTDGRMVTLLYTVRTNVTYTRLYTASSVSYWQCRCHRQQVGDLSMQLDAWNST